MASVLLRAVVAWSVLVGIVAWFSWRAEQNRFAAGCVVAGSLVVYLLLAYFFVPNLKRTSPAPIFSSYTRKHRATLTTIKWCFLPGRLIAIALVDFVALLFGKSVDHQTTKVDVK